MTDNSDLLDLLESAPHFTPAVLAAVALSSSRRYILFSMSNFLGQKKLCSEKKKVKIDYRVYTCTPAWLQPNDSLK